MSGCCRSARSHDRRAVAVAVLVVVLAATTVGCGSASESGSASADGSSSSTTTAAPTTSPDTTVAATSTTRMWEPASLPSCAGLATYSAPPSWLPEVLLDGLQIDSAGDDAYTSSDVVPGPERTVYTVAELTPDGTVLSTFDLTSGGGPLTRWDYDSVTGDDEVAEVRGLPGSIAHLINRGDSAGHIDAVWVEDGLQWIARAQNVRMTSESADTWTVAAMAEALEPLQLSADSVQDPTGRFVVIGRSAVDQSVESRRTLIDLGLAMRGVASAPIGVEIRPRAEGATGLTAPAQIAGGPGTVGPGATDQGMTITQIDGRAVASSRTTASMELPDGSIATAKVNGSFDVDVDGRTVTPSWDRPDAADLVDLLVGLVPVDASDPRLLDVPMPQDSGIPICSGDR